MAEQHKEPTAAESKEKNSSLDGEIGKEFLSSWKSMSMADDDAMDFSFDTISKSKSKKKTFDFENLDMNFNLDGEFDKISSFKLDMSDLDFTCSPKKTSQSKDKKEEVSGAKAGKQHGFNFNFDFNELDSFNLDSSLIKVDTTSNSNLRKKEVTKEGSDNEGAKTPKTNDDGVHASNNSMAMKPHVSEMLETSKVETSVGSLGNLVSKQDGSVSEISSSRNLDMPIENQTFDRHKITEEIDQEKDFPEKKKSTESKSEQVINIAPSQLVDRSDSEQDTISDQQTTVVSSGTRAINVSGDKQELNDKAMYEHRKVFSSGTRVINVSGDKQEVNDKAMYVKVDGLDLQLEHSSPPHITKSDSRVGEAINLGSSAEGVTIDPQPEKKYKGYDNINKDDALRKISCDNDTRNNKKTTLECHLAPANSKPVVDTVILMKDEKLQDMQSNMFSTPEDKRPLKQPSTFGTKGISFGSKKNADMHLGSISQARENFRSNDTRLGSKLVSDFLPGSSKLMRDAAAFPGSKDGPKSSSNTRECIVSDVTPTSGKLAGNIQSFQDEENKSKAIFLETGTSTKDVSMLSSQVNSSCLTEKKARIATKISIHSQPEASGKEPSQKSRIASIEGNRTSFKVCKITPSLSSLKTLRNIGANRVLATSLHQKETNSLVSSGQSMEIQGIIASKSDQTNSLVSSGQSMEIQGIISSKSDHPTDSGDNQRFPTPCLKRKTIEVSEDFTSLRSLKRLSQSPSKSRNFKESSEEVVGEVESVPNNLLYKHSTSELKSPSEIKEREMEIPYSVLMEDNSNVEKTEAYMKELEDICNMLKRKHEEAKELLVRAIVNDNNLLMLNHPIYEEEIRKVQKFASQLMAKGIQT